MNRIASKSAGRGFALVLAAAVAAVLPAGRVIAQAAPASVHGHVNNAAGMLVKGAVVKLTTDHTADPKTIKWLYTFPVDEATGDYKGTGIAPNSYTVAVVVGDTIADFFADLPFKAGEDKLVAFDMTRKEFIDKLTPEQKKQIEDFKKNNAEATAANSKIANLNVALKQARDDIKAGNYDAAAASMTQATTQKPEEAVLWVTLGDAQLGIADKALKAAKSAGQPATDPSVVQKYTDATASYKKAVDLNAASKKPNPEIASDAYNQMGAAFAHSGDAKSATESYDQAAKAEPAKAGVFFLNEAVVLFNGGKTDDAAVAADKAIAADPNKADAYYIKGQALIQKVTVDPKTQKLTAPPGCVDAYQKYLELAPEGAHANEVKEILTGIGEKVKSTYKAGKK